MPVAELRQRMTNTEFIYWQRYYARKAQRVELDAAKVGR